MKKENHPPKNLLAGAAVALAAVATPAFAQQKPFPDAGTAQPPAPPKAAAPAEANTGTNAVPTPNPVEGFLSSKLPDAIANGKFNLNERLRYEQVDEEGVPAIS